MEELEEPLKVLVTFDKPESTDPKTQMEYDQVNDNFRMLADIRFKLLALVPPLGGVAIFALSTMANPKGLDSSQYALALLVSVLGFLATLGITFYDQRNSELYNALGGRANYLEHHAGLDLDPDAEPSKATAGGQFLDRAKATRRLVGLLLMKHDRGLALIYGSVLGAWFFPILSASLGWANSLEWLDAESYRSWLPIAGAAVMVIVFIIELLRLDDTFSENRWGTVLDYDWPELKMDFTIRNQSKRFTGKVTSRCKVQMADGSSGDCTARPPQKGDRIRVRYKKEWWRKRDDPAPYGSASKPKSVFRIKFLDEKPNTLHNEAGAQTKPAS